MPLISGFPLLDQNLSSMPQQDQWPLRLFSEVVFETVIFAVGPIDLSGHVISP